VEGVRHDPNLTRAQAYRRGIETIRRIAGDRFILGCGQPIGPSIGIVDGARIGPDVAPFWHPTTRAGEGQDMSAVSTLNALRNVFSRWWMHESLWLNDPDCLMVRDAETALTINEVRTLASAIALSGGMVLDSDRLPSLDDERREIISKLLPVYGKSAAPLDFFESDGMPSFLELDCGRHKMLGVFNWADEEREMAVQLPGEPTHVFETWRSAYRGVVEESITLSLPPHGCELLRLTPLLERPQVVGSTFHVLQGAVEIEDEAWDGESLVLRLRPVAVSEGELIIAVPDGFGVPHTDDGEASALDPGTWSVRTKVETGTRIELTFR
jgi:alpha-galactosidase